MSRLADFEVQQIATAQAVVCCRLRARQIGEIVDHLERGLDFPALVRIAEWLQREGYAVDMPGKSLEELPVGSFIETGRRFARSVRGEPT